MEDIRVEDTVVAWIRTNRRCAAIDRSALLGVAAEWGEDVFACATPGVVFAVVYL